MNKKYINKRLPEKIKKAVEKGELIPYDDVFDSYSKKDQEQILKEARYIMAAMELRKLRKKLKLSQAKLAKQMNVKREFISRIEGGRQNITLDTLYRIAEATGKEFRFTFQ